MGPAVCAQSQPSLCGSCNCVQPDLAHAGSSSTYTWYRRALKVVRQHVSRPVDLRKEYGKVIELDCDIDHPCDVAESGAAEGRNRYCDVLPYDYNRWVSASTVAGGSCIGRSVLHIHTAALFVVARCVCYLTSSCTALYATRTITTAFV
jgi:hypothetical protein